METDPFSRALAALASPAVDPNARREAEAFVTAAGEDPAVVLALLRHLEPASAVAPETRHLAAVLLSTSAGKHWRALDDHVRRATQSGVLAALAHAEDPATLRALAHAADVVAQSSTTTSTSWDDLLPSLSDAARSPKDAHREAASLLLGNLVESMGEHLSAHHEALVDLFVAASAAGLERWANDDARPPSSPPTLALGWDGAPHASTPANCVSDIRVRLNPANAGAGAAPSALGPSRDRSYWRSSSRSRSRSRRTATSARGDVAPTRIHFRVESRALGSSSGVRSSGRPGIIANPRAHTFTPWNAPSMVTPTRPSGDAVAAPSLRSVSSAS